MVTRVLLGIKLFDQFLKVDYERNIPVKFG
jgi:hypothetical protein